MPTTLPHQDGRTEAPNGVIAVEPAGTHVQARVGDAVVADTTRALRLLERNHDPVLYLPAEDVDPAVLEASDRSTHCPWKGDASYWDVVVDGERAAGAVWYYPAAHEGALDLSAYVAFDPEQATVTEG